MLRRQTKGEKIKTKLLITNNTIEGFANYVQNQFCMSLLLLLLGFPLIFLRHLPYRLKQITAFWGLGISWSGSHSFRFSFTFIVKPPPHQPL